MDLEGFVVNLELNDVPAFFAAAPCGEIAPEDDGWNGEAHLAEAAFEAVFEVADDHVCHLGDGVEDIIGDAWIFLHEECTGDLAGERGAATDDGCTCPIADEADDSDDAHREAFAGFFNELFSKGCVHAEHRLKDFVGGLVNPAYDFIARWSGTGSGDICRGSSHCIIPQPGGGV